MLNYKVNLNNQDFKYANYDLAKNITSTTDDNGNTITYVFNSLNTLKEIKYQEGEKWYGFVKNSWIN